MTRNRMLRTLLTLTMCGWAAPPALADDVATLRGLREQIIGPAIARGADFTAHSPQAAPAGSGFRCHQPSASGMSDAEYQARLSAITGEAQTRNAAIMKEKMELMNARRARPSTPLEEYQARLGVLQARETAAAEEAHAAGKQLDAERKRAHSAASAHVAITLQHAPRDARATIIPFAGPLPAPTFVAELNRALQPFLATCGDRASVIVSHVYRDLFPLGGVDVERRFEKPIAAFNYSLRGGTLSLDPQANSRSWLANNGYSGGPRFTLATARENLEAAVAESRRASATYRRDHAVLARRQPGIVYKLDAYWAKHRVDPTWDAVRRIFDGDFSGQKASWQFKAAFYMFGDLYSSRCRSEVSRFVTHRIPYSRIVATRTYTSGRVEHDRVTDYITVQIDERFEPQWLTYEPAVTRQILVAIGNITDEMGSLTTASNTMIMESLRKSQQVSMFARFFQDHACSSATMLQLRENLVRVANDRPSVQQAGLRLPNAERESDPGR